MKTVDEQQQPRQREREREKDTHNNNKQNTCAAYGENTTNVQREAGEGGGVHKKLISFIKVTRTEPTNQLNLEYVILYSIYICLYI